MILNNMSIEKKIKDLYKSKLMTQEDLANKIGITVQGLSKALRTNDFKISTLEKIAGALDVPLGYFFEDSLPKSNKNYEEVEKILKDLLKHHVLSRSFVINDIKVLKWTKEEQEKLDIALTIIGFENILSFDDLKYLLEQKLLTKHEYDFIYDYKLKQINIDND